MTKTTETMEDRFDERFGVINDDTIPFSEQYSADDHKAFIRTEIELARQEEAAAYGGCTNCYGKGYSTTKMYASGRHYTHEQNPYIPCKECDRGTQFAKAQERARQEGEKAERERIRAWAIEQRDDIIHQIAKHGVVDPRRTADAQSGRKVVLNDLLEEALTNPT